MQNPVNLGMMFDAQLVEAVGSAIGSDLYFKMMNFVLQMMNLVFKMIILLQMSR